MGKVKEQAQRRPSNRWRRKDMAVETLPQVAAFFGVSVGTVNGWRSRGMPGKAGVGKRPGMFYLQEIAEWRFNRDDMIDRSRVLVEAPSKISTRTKLEIAKLSQDIQIQAVKLKDLQRSLIDVDVATYVIERLVQEHSLLCDELTKRICEMVPKPGATIKETASAEIADCVEALVNELRAAMASGLQGWIGDLEAK